MDLSVIVAVDRNWAIGYKNNLLVKLSEDHKMLKEKTKNKAIVMGRKTFESLPGQKPLKDRINVVMTRKRDYKAEGIIICNSFEQMKKVLKDYSEEIFVFGGEMLYRKLLPYCKKAYVTKIDASYKADAYFTNLDENKDWILREKGTWKMSLKGIKYRFDVYYHRLYQD